MGVEGYLKLRSTMQKRALMTSWSNTADCSDRICVLNGLYAADWSKVRPLVFAVAGDNGTVLLYDLGGTKAMVPVAELRNSGVSAAPASYTRILSLQFNHKQRDFLAAGDAAGQVHIWQLSWELSNAASRESEILNAYMNIEGS